MPTYKPKSDLRTRRSGVESDHGLKPYAEDEYALTALDRPLVDVEALQQAKLKERVERERRSTEASTQQRRTLLIVGALVLVFALAAGAGLGAYLALSS